MVTKKDKHLAAAQKYLERGSFEKALTEFQGAVKDDPKDTRTWLRMAEVYVRLGQNDKATEVYQKTVDLYVEQGFFQRAVAVYKNIIKLSPDFVEARIKLADVFRQLGLLSDAVQHLEQAAALFQKSNRSAEALSAIKQIVDLNPEQPGPRIRYAELASQAGAVKEAAAEFAEAAKLLKSQGRTEEFLRVAERLLHYEPDNHAMSLEVAAKYLDANNARAALPRLKPVFEARSRDPEVLELLARTFEQLNQPHKTLPVLKELARVYGEAGRMGERNHAAQRVLSMDPNDAEMQELVGRPLPKTATTPAPRRRPNGSAVTHAAASGIPDPSSGWKRQRGRDLYQAPRQHHVQRDGSPAGTAQQVRHDARRAAAAPACPRGSTSPPVWWRSPRVTPRSSASWPKPTVFVKYGLIERAADHLRRVFDRVPTHQGAHERAGGGSAFSSARKTEAAAEYETLAHQFQGRQTAGRGRLRPQGPRSQPRGTPCAGGPGGSLRFPATHDRALQRKLHLDGATHGNPRAGHHRERRNRSARRCGAARIG